MRENSVFVRLPSRRRRSRFPWVTLLLVTACMAGFTWFSLLGTLRQVDFIATWGVVPSRLLHGSWSVMGGVRLFSALFVHANWLHLLGNMAFLLIFGIPTERVLGRGTYAALFLGAGALANLAGALSVADAHIAMVGCSGAVSALMGAYLALFPRAELGIVLPLGLYFEFVRVPALVLIGLWVGLQLLFTWLGASFGAVVWWTHIVGFLLGLGTAIMMRPVLARRQRHSR